MTHDERGSVLLITLLMVVVMAVLGITLLSSAYADRKIASNEAEAAKAFAVAEAGIEDARAALATTNVNTLLASGGHLFTGSSVGGGTYVVDVTNNVNPHVPTFPTAVVPVDPGGASSDTDRFLVLNSTGTLRKAKRGIETVVRMPQGFFDYGLWCDSGATFSGSSFMDAYNSTVGPYGGANVTADASAFCNGNFTLSGSAMINGNCTVGDTTCAASHVSGTVTGGAPTQTLTPVACPAGGYPASVPAGPGISYNAATGALDVNGGNNITLPVPPTSYYFSSVTLGGGSTMTLSNGAGQHVDIYVSGSMTTSGAGVVNTASDPTKLTLFACGPGTASWTLSGTSGGYYAVYAPTRDITISGGSSFYGAIVGDNVTNSGGSMIHYDHALAGSHIPTVVARTWREVFP